MDELSIYILLTLFIQLLLFLPLFILFYFSDNALLSSIPASVYNEYINEKSFHYIGDDTYSLSKCVSHNQTLFLIESRYALFSETYQRVFDAQGNKTCTNDFSVYECKQSCPYDKCIDDNFTCDVIDDKLTDDE